MLTDGDFGELSEDQRWAVQAIDRNSQRLLSLIEDMLTLAKIENGGLALDVAPTDVTPLFAEIEAAAAPLARAKSIDLGLEISAGVPAVLADRSALERAIMNLVSNAVKFTPEGGRVRVRASHSRTNAVFCVGDTGMGISAEDRDRLFTRFFRSPTAMSMAIPGTGLGLAIVKKIIDDHGGTIHVESAPGAGTTVEFTIPLAPPVAHAGTARVLDDEREEATAARA
jgi:signal transduction histidine kinase